MLGFNGPCPRVRSERLALATMTAAAWALILRPSQKEFPGCARVGTTIYVVYDRTPVDRSGLALSVCIPLPPVVAGTTWTWTVKRTALYVHAHMLLMHNNMYMYM